MRVSTFLSTLIWISAAGRSEDTAQRDIRGLITSPRPPSLGGAGSPELHSAVWYSVGITSSSQLQWDFIRTVAPV